MRLSKYTTTKGGSPAYILVMVRLVSINLGQFKSRILRRCSVIMGIFDVFTSFVNMSSIQALIKFRIIYLNEWENPISATRWSKLFTYSVSPCNPIKSMNMHFRFPSASMATETCVNPIKVSSMMGGNISWNIMLGVPTFIMY